MTIAIDSAAQQLTQHNRDLQNFLVAEKLRTHFTLSGRILTYLSATSETSFHVTLTMTKMIMACLNC